MNTFLWANLIAFVAVVTSITGAAAVLTETPSGRVVNALFAVWGIVILTAAIVYVQITGAPP